MAVALQRRLLIERSLRKRCGGLFPCLDAGIEQRRPKGRALRHNCWRIYYGDVHVGTIADRVTDNAGHGPAPLLDGGTAGTVQAECKALDPIQ